MARKRMEEPALKSWDDVNSTLKEIVEAEIELTRIEAEMNAKTAQLKEKAEDSAKPHRDRIKKCEMMVKEFTQANKVELDGKSREMSFGRVGFRLSTKLVLPKLVGNVIQALRQNRMEDCIICKESVNKDILKTYSEDAIIMVGGTLKKEDTFWYETKQEELPRS